MMLIRGVVAGLIAGLVLVGDGALPAAAQTALPVEMTLLPPKRPKVQPPSAQPQPLSLAAASLLPSPARAPDAQASPAQQPAPVAKPVMTAAATPIVPVWSGHLPDRTIIERANAYFNGLSALSANFTQIGADGRRLTGRLYLQRPGRVRFEYDAPSTLEVIADGSSVAVRDTKLATQDLYPISQTPLKFLLRDPINLGQDLRVTEVASEADSVRIALEDRSTLGGTSKITLFFDRNVETLTRWRIVDPQGFQTTVVLSNVDRSRRVDPRLFVINYERILQDNR